MTIKTIGAYNFEPRDKVENFHGNQLVYFLWERHLMFTSPFTTMLSPFLSFAEVISDVLPGLYGQHPQFAEIEWDKVQWKLDDEPFTPDASASLTEQKIGHKSMLRFSTPGLDGLAGAAF